VAKALSLNTTPRVYFFVDILYTDKAFTIIAPPGYYKFVVNNKGAIWNGVSTWSSPFTCE